MSTPAPVPMQDPRGRLRHALERAAHWLPIQAPLEVFVHNNLLVAFQHLPFHQAMLEARRKLGVRGYLPEERYQEAFARGRITDEDLDAVFADEPLSDAPIAVNFPSPRTVARMATRHQICAETPADLHWQVVEKEATTYFAPAVPEAARMAIVASTDDWLRPQLAHHLAGSPAKGGDEALARLIVGTPPFRTPVAELTALLGDRLRVEAFAERNESVAVRSLWTACVDACAHYDGMPVIGARTLWTHRELLRACTDEDANELVHATIIPLCAAFLDRGQSHWSMPDRADGFFQAWLRVKLAGVSIRPGWLAGMSDRLREWQGRKVTAEDVVLELLAELGVEPDEYEAYIERTLGAAKEVVFAVIGVGEVMDVSAAAAEELIKAARGGHDPVLRFVPGQQAGVAKALQHLPQRTVQAELRHPQHHARVRAPPQHRLVLAEPREHAVAVGLFQALRRQAAAGGQQARRFAVRPQRQRRGRQRIVVVDPVQHLHRAHYGSPGAPAPAYSGRSGSEVA